MTEAMPFLQKYDITFLRPLPISGRSFLRPIQFCVPDSLGILYFQGDQRMLEHKMD